MHLFVSLPHPITLVIDQLIGVSLMVTPALNCSEIHISCGTVCFLDNLLRTLTKPLEFHRVCVRWLIKSNVTLTVLLNERESEMGLLVFIAKDTYQ